MFNNSLADIATFKVSFFRVGNSNSLAGNEYDQMEGEWKANKTIENKKSSPGFSPEPAYIIK